MKILAISDTIIEHLYTPYIRDRYPDISAIISCGDLPYYYTEYVLSLLNKPLFFIRGNHDIEIEIGSTSRQYGPAGGIDLHRRVVNWNKFLLAGVEGSLRYRDGPFMYTPNEMWLNVFSLIPGLMLNYLRFGRYLDCFISHAPPFGTHDKRDLAHRGVKAFTWFARVFKPSYHLHGHIHVYRCDEPIDTLVEKTRVINCYGYREIEMTVKDIDNLSTDKDRYRPVA